MVAQLEDLAEIIAAHVVLTHDETADPNDRFSAKVHLALDGKDVVAEKKAETIHIALDLVAGTLARQLRKRKTSLIDKRRRKLQRKNKRERGG